MKNGREKYTGYKNFFCFQTVDPSDRIQLNRQEITELCKKFVYHSYCECWRIINHTWCDNQWRYVLTSRFLKNIIAKISINIADIL